MPQDTPESTVEPTASRLSANAPQASCQEGGQAVERVDVAIIGGGLVGASLGTALAELIEHSGLKVAVVEAAPMAPLAPSPQEAAPSAGEDDAWQPSFDARASAIAAGSAAHFSRLGVWSAMAAKASAISLIHVSEKGRLGATRLRADEMGVEALGYVVPNAWMGRVLHRRLAELPLDWHCPARVERIEPVAAGHRLWLSSGSVLEAGLTVLADGGRSGLKEALGIESDAAPYDQVAMIANVAVGRPHQGVAYERFTRQGPMALLPLPGQAMELVWTHEKGSEQRRLALSDRAFLEELQAAFGDRAGAFVKVGQRHVYPLSLVTARETTRPGLAVLGNAAHALHPVAGQGFNLALRGVIDLVEAIEQGLEAGQAPGSAATLAAFERRREADQRNVVRFSDGLIRLFGIDQPLLSHARAAGLIGLNLAGPLRRGLARRAMGSER
ncbi:2-octaprenyl-6-methoxyphenyl hydroxylase [Halomonas sp. DP5N14-9]|uniref:2-octaprenyl-6-methoxyphenyl hydroxylase n=1 Tax=Halomonas sp. DP5N14-9 TaxID=2859075 RepID=UPI001C99ADDB|nr:2-octaprenyl-6-methoxyphenyl hydroxylase [Halomonas sp. DP5N14-9]MBY5939420.1 2-octaprenyl-6-methoxyphenyl hydroxylase [Halomonas sp. DP5N14-9]